LKRSLIAGVLYALVACAAAAQTAAPAPGADDCGCKGNADCLLFCPKRSVTTPGSIGSLVGNKGVGAQERVNNLDPKATAPK
jgi:hypothetical protein